MFIYLFSFSFDRYCPEQVMPLLDHSIITWLLTCVCAPHCIKNPYVTAKLVEVLFVTSPSTQPKTPLQVAVRDFF